MTMTTPTVRAAAVRVERSKNERLKTGARQAGLAASVYIAQLITEYADGEPGEKPQRDRPQRDLVEVRVPITDEVFQRALARAKAEGKRGLSEVVDTLAEQL